VNLVDANVLLYAVNGDDPKHRESREWLEGALGGGGGETVGFAWAALLAFLRLSTKVGLFPDPLPVREALACVKEWVDQPAGAIVESSTRHFELLGGLLNSVGTGGNLVGDAHLAALALEHDATVITYDSDFGRFAGVRWRRPGSGLTGG